MSERFVLRSDSDALHSEPLMKFRLFYQGPLLAANSRDQDTDRRAGHKHELRRAFHKQLKHYPPLRLRAPT